MQNDDGLKCCPERKALGMKFAGTVTALQVRYTWRGKVMKLMRKLLPNSCCLLSILLKRELTSTQTYPSESFPVLDGSTFKSLTLLQLLPNFSSKFSTSFSVLVSAISSLALRSLD